MASADLILGERTVSHNKLVVSAAGSKMPLRLKRHLAPRTVRMILQSLPISGNAHVSGGMVYVNTDIDSGLERGRERFASGDVAFMPGHRCICFFTGDVAPGVPLTPVGSIISGSVDALTRTNPGDMLDIYEDTG